MRVVRGLSCEDALKRTCKMQPLCIRAFKLSGCTLINTAVLIDGTPPKGAGILCLMTLTFCFCSRSVLHALLSAGPYVMRKTLGA